MPLQEADKDAELAALQQQLEQQEQREAEARAAVAALQQQLRLARQDMKRQQAVHEDQLLLEQLAAEISKQQSEVRRARTSPKT
jgi:hypothetical protein